MRFEPIFGVSLTDQFIDSNFAEDKLFDIKTPRWLCNPVEKNGEEIKNLDNHLMCFSVEPASGQPRHERIEDLSVNDQFGPGRADTKIERELCVPSTKSGGTFPRPGDDDDDGDEEEKSE